MAELKKIRVREAKPRDIGLFKKLWKDFLVEQQSLGSIVKGDSDRTNEVYSNVFNMYVGEEPSYQGVVLFIGEIAVVMAGDNGIDAEFTIGTRPANVFGVYVAPDHRGKGLATKLYEEAFKRLKTMGFDAVYGTIINDNVGSVKTLEKAAGNATAVPERPVYAKL